MNNKLLIKFLKQLKDYKEKKIQQFKEKVDTSYLSDEEFIEEFEKNKLNTTIIENFFRIFITSNPKWSELRIQCNDYKELSDLLIELELNTRECTEIIFLLVEKNLTGKILENPTYVIDYQQLQNYPYKTLTKDQLQDEYLIYQLLIENKKEIVNWNIAQKKEFFEVAKDFIIDMTDIKMYHQSIKEHYLDKKNNYIEIDKIITIRSLKELGVNDNILKKIEHILTTNLENRIKKQKITTIQINDSTNIKRSQNKSLKDQIEEKVNLKEMMPKNNLTYPEIIALIISMNQLKFNQEDIYLFLRNTEIERNCLNIHPITRYIEEYEKLNYYKEKQILNQEFKNLEDYFSMLWITTEEDYYFWKKSFEEELKNYLKAIPGGFEYELETIKKIKRQNK